MDMQATTQARVVPVLLSDLVMLCHSMREDERDQWKAFTGYAEYNADTAARMFAAQGGVSWTLVNAEGEPVASGGFEEVRPKVWQTWMIGSDEAWAKHWKLLTRTCRRYGDTLLNDGHANRIQTFALAGREMACRWYESLGARFESRMEAFCADGRDAVCYVKTRTP